MESQINRILNKLEKLRQVDSERILFGADTHKYLLKPTLTNQQVKEFELENKVELPMEYVLFLTKIGDGGAGPFYGVNTLEGSRIVYYADSKESNPIYFNLSKPFPHTDEWNVAEELEDYYDKIEDAFNQGNEELEQKLLDEKLELISGEEHDYGRLYISDFGCGIVISLIVSGAETGNMWTDNRTHDAGLYPADELGNKDRITFLNWYELWLDNSIDEIKTINNGINEF